MRQIRIIGSLAVLMLLVASQASAAELLVEPSIGVKAGANSSVLQVQGSGTSNRIGFTGGAYFKLPLGQMTVQIEALYSQKGFRKSSFEDIKNWEVKLDYVELPVTLNVDIPMGKVNPYIYGGVSIGFLVNSQEKSSGTNDEWVDLDDKVNSSNTTLLLGLGLRMSRFALDFRFNHGLTDINNFATRTEIMDRTFSFTASYAIWN